MAEIKYYSKEGLQKLKDELHQMITIERPAISAAIAEARDKETYPKMQNTMQPRKHKDFWKPR